jgi:hypothetical protein
VPPPRLLPEKPHVNRRIEYLDPTGPGYRIQADVDLVFLVLWYPMSPSRVGSRPLLYLVSKPNSSSGEACLRSWEVTFTLCQLVYSLTRHAQNLCHFRYSHKFDRHT